MRPLSFTRNFGGLEKAYAAIRKGYLPGIPVNEFRKRCGLSSGQSLLVTEFLLGTQILGNEEQILADTLVVQTLSLPYSALIARLYFFAINLNMPGERLRNEHRNPAEMQNTLVREHLFVNGGLRAEKFDKVHSLTPTVKSFGGFTSAAALTKWVNNYSHLAKQCQFVITPDGRLETFPDTWAILALRLFFERCAATDPDVDADALLFEAETRQLHKLIGAPSTWLEERIGGAAEMFVSGEDSVFQGFKETERERNAAAAGAEPAAPSGGQAIRRERLQQQLIRRAGNRKFLQTVYDGECQLSGVRLVLPQGKFSVDCAHIRPLGRPHSGEDHVSNMLSLSPTMHRLFDRGCVRIDPDTLAIRLLHGNDIPHRDRLLTRGQHRVNPENLAYHVKCILGESR
jgi:hypothetical protein